jgi:hypothetical protein
LVGSAKLPFFRHLGQNRSGGEPEAENKYLSHHQEDKIAPFLNGRDSHLIQSLENEKGICLSPKLGRKNVFPKIPSKSNKVWSRTKNVRSFSILGMMRENKVIG